MRRDLHHYIKPVQNIATQVITTTPIAGTIVDTQGYAALEYIVTSGTIATGGTFTMTLDWGNNVNLTDATPVPASNIFGAFTTMTSANSNNIQSVGVYLTTYRYVRLTITGTGGTPSGTFTATSIVAEPTLMPSQ